MAMNPRCCEMCPLKNSYATAGAIHVAPRVVSPALVGHVICGTSREAKTSFINSTTDGAVDLSDSHESDANSVINESTEMRSEFDKVVFHQQGSHRFENELCEKT